MYTLFLINKFFLRNSTKNNMKKKIRNIIHIFSASIFFGNAKSVIVIFQVTSDQVNLAIIDICIF